MVHGTEGQSSSTDTENGLKSNSKLQQCDSMAGKYVNHGRMDGNIKGNEQDLTSLNKETIEENVSDDGLEVEQMNHEELDIDTEKLSDQAENKQLQCNICDTKFTMKETLEDHLLAHRRQEVNVKKEMEFTTQDGGIKKEENDDSFENYNKINVQCAVDYSDPAVDGDHGFLDESEQKALMVGSSDVHCNLHVKQEVDDPNESSSDGIVTIDVNNKAGIETFALYENIQECDMLIPKQETEFVDTMLTSENEYGNPDSNTGSLVYFDNVCKQESETTEVKDEKLGNDQDRENSEVINIGNNRNIATTDKKADGSENKITDEKKLTCVTSDKVFNSRSVLNCHVKKACNVNKRTGKSEKRINSLQCNFCGKKYARKQQLQRHEKTHTDERPYQCQECGSAFREKYDLKRHMKIHSDEKPYKCTMCDKAFVVKRYLGYHVYNVHTERSQITKDNEKRHQCTMCDKKFRKTSHLSSHMISHTGEKNFLCTTCGKAFKHKAGLRIHLLTHTDEIPYQCTRCNKTFRYQSTLKKHTDSQCDKKTFLCTTCGRSFASERYFKEHSLSHSNEPPYSCTECGKSFNLRTTLHAHKLTHTTQPSHECPICGFECKTKRIYNTHVLRHTSTEQIPCTVCGKVFKTKRDLTLHKTTHINVRRYVCTVCDKAFGTKAHLDQHVSTHTNEKPFKCTVCTVGFKRKPNLEEHMRTHTGEKNPFQCTFCDKSFVRKCLLEKHVHMHVGQRP